MYEAYTASEVAFKLPLEISSLASQKSSQSVLAGSKPGHLLVYSPNQNGRRYELETFCKRFERRMVTDLAVCEQEEILFCLSDGQISARLLMQPFTVKALLTQLRPTHTFTTTTRKPENAVYLAVSARKRLHLFQWSGDDFIEATLDFAQSWSVDPSCVVWVGDTIACAVRDEYHLLHLHQQGPLAFSASSTRLFSLVERPLIVSLPDRGLLALARQETLTLSTLEGKRVHGVEDVRWSEAPLAVEYDSPYLVALLSKGRIEVRSVHPGLLIQTMILPKASLLATTRGGNVLVGSPFDIWELQTGPNLRKNVSTLLSDRHFALAIQLADGCSLFTDENRVEMRRQAAMNLFQQRKFEEAFNMHMQIGTDVVSVLQLFPDLLPEALRASAAPLDLPENEKKRAVLALANYLSAVRTLHAQRLCKESLSPTEAEQLRVGLQVVDTTLLKCHLKTRPMLVDPLLRLADNACFFDDAVSILKQAGRMSSLFVLYETRGRHALALDLLRSQAKDPDAEPFFHGVDQTVEYLQTLGNQHLDLIFEHAAWVLAEDEKEGLSIFTSSESELARQLDRERVVEWLRKECVGSVVAYLEHVILEWGEGRPRLHDLLAEHYIAKAKTLMDDYVHAFGDDECIVRAGSEEGELGKVRGRLLHFLTLSHAYSPHNALIALAGYPFYEERALVLGRLKQHEQALSIYTNVLHDLQAAEDYCKLYYDRDDADNSQVYLLLFRALVCPAECESGGVECESAAPQPPPTPNVQHAAKMLSRHADSIDTVAALSLIPAGTPLRLLSKALNAVLQSTHDKATALSIRSSVCVSAATQSEARLRGAEASRVLLTAASECTMCGKKIANSAFVRYPNTGCLVHFYCYESTQETVGSPASPLT